MVIHLEVLGLFRQQNTTSYPILELTATVK